MLGCAQSKKISQIFSNLPRKFTNFKARKLMILFLSMWLFSSKVCVSLTLSELQVYFLFKFKIFIFSRPNEKKWRESVAEKHDIHVLSRCGLIYTNPPLPRTDRVDNPTQSTRCDNSRNQHRVDNTPLFMILCFFNDDKTEELDNYHTFEYTKSS